MQRREFVSLIAALAGAAHGGCGRRQGTSPAARIRVAASPQPANSALYLGMERGYFAEAGLELELHRIPNSAQAIPLLAGGKLDAALFALSPALINAVTRGAAVRIVAGREITSPNCTATGTLFGRRQVFDRGLDDLSQLRGKRVAISRRASLTEWFLDILLAEAGLTSSDVRLVTLRQPEALAALTAGNIDAMLGYDFERDLTELSGDIVKGAGVSQVRPNLQYSFVIFGELLLHREPEAGVRFLTVYVQSARRYLAGATPLFLDEYARLNGLNPEAVKTACRGTFTPDGGVDLTSLREYLEWAVRKGYCPEPVDVEELVDMRFLNQVRAAGV